MSPKVAMRRRVRVNLPTSTPDDEVGKPPQPENRRVIHRYRVPAHEVHGRGGESTATQKLTRIVGKPPEIIEPEDAETLSKLEYAYKKYEDDPNDTAKGRYYLALPLVSGSKPSETTIQAFINQKLPEHKDEEKFKFKAGVFLSAVIQTSPDKRITLDVTKLPTLEFLCLRLENKEVTIIGDVGEDTAVCAKSGSVTVKGNAGNATGANLEGASVVVEGNTGAATAHDAEYGSVTVKGNVGDRTGLRLNGATIVVEGNAGHETAYLAKCGSVTVKGNAGNGTGWGLDGASVVVEGNTGKNTAKNADSGVIRVGGKIKSLGGDINPNVKVFEAGQQIWPKKRWWQRS